MKHMPAIAGVLLGLLFLAAAVPVLFHLIPPEEMPPPPTEEAGLFMKAVAPTGYLTFIKVLEVVGGILVMIPAVRNLGLLVLGPIIVNILAYDVFITKGTGLDAMGIGMTAAIVVLALYLLWVERKRVLGCSN